VSTADADTARDELDPDDFVGNELLDAHDETAHPALIRVLNHHGSWAESVPSHEDIRRTLDICDQIVARWPATDAHGSAILVTATIHVGSYKRKLEAGRDGDGGKIVTGRTIEELVDLRGLPELVALQDVAEHFDGGASE